MSETSNSTPTVDMVRWTFSVNPEHRAAIESHLVDMGLDVVVLGESQFHVIWEENDRDQDEVAAELWDMNEATFDITHEEFHRVSLMMIHHEDDDAEVQAA